LWTPACDPLEVEPECPFNADATVQQGGTAKTCDDLRTTQSERCVESCRPLTPNGCDCFGCCTVPGVGGAVWLGSTFEDGEPSCDLQSLTDPTRCRPCTQVPSCTNPCEPCEICLGKSSVTDDCSGQEDAGASDNQQCDEGVQPCGLSGQEPCSSGGYCITGCCVLIVY
jgi:hypothetical protein